MPTQEETDNLLIPDLAKLMEPFMLPLAEGFFYYSLPPMPDEDLKPYLHEPVEALPPAIRNLVSPPIKVLLVPFLNSPDGINCRLAYQPPAHASQVRIIQNYNGERLLMALAVRNEPVPEYHHTFFRAIARHVASEFPLALMGAYEAILTGELDAGIHGEVDESSWLLKQELNGKKIGKKFEQYFRASLEDTLSLYLHGICCDIDVERGPRQIASRHLRKRLECLYTFFPPPEGRAVFPEQLRS